MQRIAAIIVLLCGLAVIAYGCRALLQAEELSATMAQLSAISNRPFDRADWSSRWRWAALGIAALGATLCAGGVSHLAHWWFRRAVIAGGLAIAAAIQLVPYFSGEWHYVWEPRLGLALTTVAASAAYSWAALHDWRLRSHAASSAT